MRKIIWYAAASVLCTLAYAGNADSTRPVADNAKPDAALTLSAGSVAAGIGYMWRHGQLKTADRSHLFSIKRVSVLDVGATGFDATGSVYNLSSLADFSLITSRRRRESP
jgi:hypothetical protein